MAYVSTVTTTIKTISGRRHWLISVVETDAAATSEFTISGLPRLCTLRSYEATLTDGTGTTINPALGNVAAFTVSTQAHIATNNTTAAHVHDDSPVRMYLPTDILVIRSTPNDATADHDVDTILVVVEGHQD